MVPLTFGECPSKLRINQLYYSHITTNIMKFKTLLLAAAMMVCASASAQFTNASSKKSSSSTEVTSGWNNLYVQYNSHKFNDNKVAEFDNGSMDGFTIGYNRGIGLSNSMPLYLEVGGGLQYSTGSNDDEDMHMLSVVAPVSVLYHFSIPNSTIGIEPLAGLNFRYNGWGEIKDEDDKLDPFSKDDYDDPANRFQVGLHLGVNAVFKKFVLGLKYNIGLSNFWKVKGDYVTTNVKFNTFTISAGYRF